MRVWGDIPDEWEDLVDKAKKIEGWNSLSAYIRELIKNDLKAKGLLGRPENGGEKEAVVEVG